MSLRLKTTTPTADKVRECLNYDKTTGVFRWRHRANLPQKWNGKNAGKIAGSNHNGGYRHIAIDKVKYLAHHLAWVYVTGDWPTSFIDHKNLDKSDNRFDNLRLASFVENSINISVRKNSKSGFRGVCFWKNGWLATITKNKVTERLGTFDTPQKAAAAYAKRARELYGDYCPSYLLEM
jgi:hypothetical protein